MIKILIDIFLIQKTYYEISCCLFVSRVLIHKWLYYPNETKANFNIVLITIDALRADHLSCYGYERKTSPNIDEIANKGVLFKNAIAPCSWTAPSMVSLITAVYPINHGVTSYINWRKEEQGKDNHTIYEQESFSDELVTLSEVLKRQGYTTFCVASNLQINDKLGFARGFDYFKCLPALPAPSVNEIVYSWESFIQQADKYFLWLHYIDPHAPYFPRNPWIDDYTSDIGKILNFSEFSLGKHLEFYHKPTTDNGAIDIVENSLAHYDSEINYADFFIGEIIRKFEFKKNTLLIITSDHGEEFFDHGSAGHGKDLYQEKLHVPLIVKLPFNSEKRTVVHYTSLIDIMPSILYLLNINLPQSHPGKIFFRK